jgi:hypothetical protein
MKRYTIFHVPIGSFFSKALYREACHHWRGTGFAYLLALLAVCWIPFLVRIHSEIAHFVEVEAPRVVSQIPTLTILNGEASIEEPQPFLIREPGTGRPLVLIDTTGATTSLEDVQAVGLITRTQVLFRKSEVETRTFHLQGVERFVLDQARIRGWLDHLKRYLAPGLYPIVVLFSFIGRVFQSLIYAAIGFLFASLCRSRRTYGELLRLSVVAVTPGILLKTIQGVAQVQIPFAGLWYFLCAMGYLYLGVKAASQEEVPASAPAFSPPPSRD